MSLWFYSCIIFKSFFRGFFLLLSFCVGHFVKKFWWTMIDANKSEEYIKWHIDVGICALDCFCLLSAQVRIFHGTLLIVPFYKCGWKPKFMICKHRKHIQQFVVLLVPIWFDLYVQLLTKLDDLQANPVVHRHLRSPCLYNMNSYWHHFLESLTC